MTQIPERDAEYRVLLQRVSCDPKTSSLDAPQFTAIIHAMSNEDAIREGEKLAVLFEGRFRVMDIQPAAHRKQE